MNTAVWQELNSAYCCRMQYSRAYHMAGVFGRLSVHPEIAE